MSQQAQAAASDALAAIQQSIRQNEIVTLPWSADVYIDLLALCDDSAGTENVHEFWGVDDEGEEWRVHVRRDASEV